MFYKYLRNTQKKNLSSSVFNKADYLNSSLTRCVKLLIWNATFTSSRTSKRSWSLFKYGCEWQQWHRVAIVVKRCCVLARNPCCGGNANVWTMPVAHGARQLPLLAQQLQIHYRLSACSLSSQFALLGSSRGTSSSQLFNEPLVALVLTKSCS